MNESSQSWGKTALQHPGHASALGHWEAPSHWDVHSFILHLKFPSKTPLDISLCFDYPNMAKLAGKAGIILPGSRTSVFGPTSGFPGCAKQSARTLHTEWGSAVPVYLCSFTPAENLTHYLGAPELQR